jgi:hypothetical protein
MPSEYTLTEQRAQRTSLYLVLRAEALLGTINFFASPAGDTSRRIQFLAQSDFWEWEIDNLIYSFTNLAERRETWSSPKATLEKLNQLGIVLKTKTITRVAWRGGWRTKHDQQRMAPVQLLRQVIERWNALMDLMEEQFVKPMQMEIKLWNVQTRTDLRSLRRTMPELDEMTDTN